MVAGLDGSRLIQRTVEGAAREPGDAVALGERLAERLRAEGAEEILREIASRSATTREGRAMSAGRVYLIGAGPGDPGLLTLRGKALLARADVVVYDYLVSPRLLEYAPARAERIYVGKRAGAHTLSQEEINRLLVERAGSGATVARLKGGDPFVFGRGGEEALALVDAGIPFEVVPGVTAGIAAPAYAGIPVTHRQLASGVGLLTGHEAPDKEESSLDWRALANWKGTLSFYMGTENLSPICEKLVAEGLDPQTPAAAIRWGTTPSQRVVTATVKTLAAAAQSAGLEPPVMIVIGRVVALREKLNWFERRPLFGRRIVVTRARAQASEFAALLEEQGAEVIELPTFRIEPPADPGPLKESVARAGEKFDWIAFTSVNAVDAFFGALSRGRPGRPRAGAAAGSRRSARRRRSGWRNTAFARTCSPARSPRRPSSRRSPRRATSRAGACCARDRTSLRRN